MTRTMIILLFLLSLTGIEAKEKIGKGMDLGANLYIRTNSEDILAEYYDLGGDLRFYFTPSDSWKFKLKIESDIDEVSMDEVSGEYEFKESYLKFGLFENSILLDDKLNSSESFFASKSFLRNRLEEMGWYTDEGLGAQYHGRGNATWSYRGSAFFSSTMSTLHVTLNMDYDQNRKNTGITACLIPVPFEQSEEPFYYMVNAYTGNLHEKDRINYKFDISLGMSIDDPGGYTHDAGLARTDALFLAADSFIGMNKKIGAEKSETLWSPALGLGWQIHDLEVPESSTADIKVGNKFVWDNTYFIHTDIGLRINTYYDPDLTTGLELIWAASFRFRY